jgi:hypothetical protein
MKTVLIPTDFKSESLKAIPVLFQKLPDEKLNIILVHMMSVTDCMRELLMLSRRSAEYQHISQDFYTTCYELKKENPNQIHDLRIDFFYGNTIAVFKNFLDANDVDIILQEQNYNYLMLNKSSIQPSTLIGRSGKTLLVIDSQKVQKESARIIPLPQIDLELAEQYV